MRRFRAALAVFALVLTSLAIAGPAAAGGPTSVLLVVPGEGRTASLYATDADYQQLARLVGAFDADGAAGKVDPSGAGHEVGTGVTVTWLVHDATVWRVDRVFLGGDGGPWISTQQNLGGTGSIWDRPAVWHAAAEGKALAALLDRLGVGVGAASDGAVEGTGSGTVVAPDSEPVGAASDDSQPVEEAVAPWVPRTDRAVWGIAGLATGVVIALAALHRVAGSRRPAVVDQLDDGLPAATEPAWTSTERLSWPAQRG